MNMRRLTIGIVTLVASSLFGVNIAAAQTPKAVAPPVAVAQPAASQLRAVRIPTASLPAATRKTLGATASHSTTAYQLINRSNWKCLDAPTRHLGVNGNPIQMWNCFDDPETHLNQLWIPRDDLDSGDHSVFTDLVNAESGKCLDADNAHGLKNGIKVQEWSCFHDSHAHSNQYWAWGPTGSWFALKNTWGGKNMVLDAARQTIRSNGGKVQLWNDLGTPNQRWLSPGPGIDMG